MFKGSLYHVQTVYTNITCTFVQTDQSLPLLVVQAVCCKSLKFALGIRHLFKMPVMHIVEGSFICFNRINIVIFCPVIPC